MSGDTVDVRESLLATLGKLEARYGSGDADEWDEAVDVAAHRAEVWRRTIPSRFTDARLDDFDGDVRVALDRWVASAPTPNLVTVGPIGVGKSHAAVAAARTRFDRGMTVGFFPVVELLDELRPGGPPDALARLIDVDVLVVDDLGTERGTDWTAERLYALLNRRWLEERPTLATTNLALTRRPTNDDEVVVTLKEALGERTWSRVVGSGAVVVRLTGPDRRRRVSHGDR